MTKQEKESYAWFRVYNVINPCLPSIGGTMRLLRKRKTLCIVLVVLAVFLSLMLSHTIVLDLSGAIRIQDLSPRNVMGHIGYIGVGLTQPKECKPARNVAFVKTHKAGSTTIANILMRYGMANDLNFALPNTKLHSYGYNYISRAGEVLTRDFIIPLPAGQEYNILFNHAIYNRTAFRLIMPKNTTYITILREPFQQFVSTFEYYRVEKYFAKRGYQIPESENPISTFLKNPYLYDRSTALFSYIRNKQSEDLGLNRQHYKNPNQLKEYIEAMDKDFTLVMILEYFDESLLLLKHALCWSIKDILYITHNVNYKKPKRNFTDADLANHRKMSHLDYELYSHFFRKFWDKLQSQGDDFFKELAHFKSLLHRVNQSCYARRSFHVKKTKWHSSFTVNKTDCRILMLPELVSLDLLYNRTSQKFKLAPNLNYVVRYGRKNQAAQTERLTVNATGT
ncbi:galactose-3-O-sulfotransferase 4-like [Biomphalaria glabrata]|uniref:Galactose-3-O-sulfotransferase 4-like n=1 Tax=Biomphalaria glabrata TaxID=6526 RepID=A0A9W2Z490_BIOGL|nr:galactose-3-O-sulfotransferase 4-like [Biomphalaria glabrata]